MTRDSLKALPDAELGQVIAWAQDEIKLRAEKRKQKAIAEIKALAAQAGVSVAISGSRGRPAKGRAKAPLGKQ